MIIVSKSSWKSLRILWVLRDSHDNKMYEQHLYMFTLYLKLINKLLLVANRLCGLVVKVPGFDSRRYQIFWEVVFLEQGPISLVSTIEELLGRNCSVSGLENRDYGSGDPLRCPRDTLYPLKLALTLPTSGSRSVGIVRLRTKTTECFCFVLFCFCYY
jgi:hypothetical protein